MPNGLVCIGYISGYWGVHGQAKIFLYNVKTELYDKWLHVELWDGQKKREPITMKLHKGSAKRVTATLQGCNQKEDLQSFLDRKILIKEEDLPLLEGDEYYHSQLLGLPVTDTNGRSYGVVKEIVSGNVDIIVVSDRHQTYYIPFLADEVVTVEVTSGLMIVPRDDDED